MAGPLIHTQRFNTPYGELLLGSYDQSLCLCDWYYRKNRKAIDQRLQQNLQAAYREHDNALLQRARQQLTEYFAHQRQQFSLPLKLVGSVFQRAVWHGLLKIPFGSTQSYLALAQQLSRPEAVRAVASANGANAISIIVPCHRVIGSNGQLTGYAGGLKTKAALLELESDLFNQAGTAEQHDYQLS